MSSNRDYVNVPEHLWQTGETITAENLNRIETLLNRTVEEVQILQSYIEKMPIKIIKFMITNSMVEIGTLGEHIKGSFTNINNAIGIEYRCKYLGKIKSVMYPGQNSITNVNNTDMWHGTLWSYRDLEVVSQIIIPNNNRFMSSTNYTIKIYDTNDNFDTYNFTISAAYPTFYGVGSSSLSPSGISYYDENQDTYIYEEMDDRIETDSTGAEIVIPYAFDTFTRDLQTTRSRNFTVNPTNGQYIWYVSPVTLGNCSFAINNTLTSFNLIDTKTYSTVDDYELEFYIYRSTNPVSEAGTISVSVS